MKTNEFFRISEDDSITEAIEKNSLIDDDEIEMTSQHDVTDGSNFFI